MTMISVILSPNPAATKQALSEGFVQQTVMVRVEDTSVTDPVEKTKNTNDALKKPNQCLLGNVLGTAY